MSQQKICYQTCNDKYSPLQPARLFCKKGCDSEDPMMYFFKLSSSTECKTETCNKLCIKQESKDQKLWFKFLYRAPTDPAPCLEACMFGCNVRGNIAEE